jgi:membrane protein DedA with SNARE-associated domain
VRETIAQLIQWYQGALDSGGYPLIALLMAMESSFLPVPSEAIIPLAAQRAHANGHLSLTGVVLAGTLGSWVGATIVYWVARLGGCPLLLRYGRYVRVTEKKLEAAERWSRRFGSFGVLAARLLPGVRQSIGLPMGIVKMDYWLYALFTVIGSGFWCVVLVWVGVAAGNDRELMAGNLRHLTLWLLGAVAVLGLLYYLLVHRYIKAGPAKEV